MLQTVEKQNNTQTSQDEYLNFEQIQLYDPFREDVFSLGLTFLQTALLCSTMEIKEFRKNEQDLKSSVNMIGDRYTDNLKSIILLMLQWNSSQRPDFIQLETVYKDILRMKDCSELLQKLMKQQKFSFLQDQTYT